MSKPIILIHKDNQQLSSGRWQSFSKRWHELAQESGITTREIDIFSSNQDWFGELNHCDAFMWWFAQPLSIIRPGRHLVTALIHGRKIPTFPDFNTIWHFDDKIAEYYLLRAAEIPTPRTWTFWSREQAEEFVTTASFPMVMKLSSGIVSKNVMLVKGAEEAKQAIKELFGSGMYSFPPEKIPFRWIAKRLRESLRILLSQKTYEEFHKGYVLFQEFLPDNDFDIRITIIGNRAFAFRRHNRPNDFRASGSGRIDWNPAEIPNDALILAFKTAEVLDTQSLAVDVLRKNGRPIIAEISYYYEGWAITACPGHWELNQDSQELVWFEGSTSPEDVIWEDFINNLNIQPELN